MKPDIVVDRASFIAWTEGYLLLRRYDFMVIGDRAENREAEDILERGGIVLMTVDSNPFSTVQWDEPANRYVETPVAP